MPDHYGSGSRKRARAGRQGSITTSSVPAAEGELRLEQGRRLAFCQYGPRDGRPVFFFHGWPGSRLDFAPNAGAADEAGARVIAIDRPGIGRSEPRPGRTVLDWPADVLAVADALGIERFAVLGFSFGGPYARACGHFLPTRVTRVGLISCLAPVDDPAAKRGMPPPTRYGLAAARLSPWLARPMVWFTARQARLGKLVGQLANSMPEPDRKILSRQHVAHALGTSLAECFRQGIGPATWDGVAVARGEGFRLEDIQSETLIWHGDLDRNDPVAMACHQERRLPRVRARYYTDEGHLIFFSRTPEILADLIAPPPPSEEQPRDRTRPQAVARY
jgi:pimeloyl-ACP methyl ester carboxylesterase